MNDQTRTQWQMNGDPAGRETPIDDSRLGVSAEAEAGAIGAILRGVRERRGYDLRDVAGSLKIRYVYMEAIEAGRVADLPGPAYAIGFIRTYADFLGLDSDSLVRRFKEDMSGRVGQQQLYFPTPVPEARVPGGTILLIAMCLAGIVYGGWYYLSATDRSMVDLIPPVFGRFAALVEEDEAMTRRADQPARPGGGAVGSSELNRYADVPLVSAVPRTDELLAQAGITLPDVEDLAARTTAATTTVPITDAPGTHVANAAPADGTETAPDAPLGPPAGGAPRADDPAPAATAAVALGSPDGAAPVAATPTVAGPETVPAAAPAPTATAAAEGEGEAEVEETASAGAGLDDAAGRVFGDRTDTTRIVLRATQDSWVKVRDRSGATLFQGLLAPGDAYIVPDQGGVRIRTGNAGGLVAFVDGARAAPLGRSGEVRNITLDPAALAATAGTP